MTLAEFAARADLSWIRELRQDPEAEKHAPNQSSREVKSGHYVKVRPTALPRPKLVIFSPEMAQELGLSEEACKSDTFAKFFTGDMDAIPGFDSWATPYALAIMGTPQYQNCPFKNGNGYGDGRAVSVGEVIAPSGQRWELQLKGGGRTPFCRGADGRAVLRSSVREFLASEAMHHLGISTTRALSLVMSEQATIERPWYSGKQDDVDNDPRLANAPAEMRQMLMMMLSQRSGEPDTMVTESCAITCRVAPSFTRIGHLDLHARRAAKSSCTAAQREDYESMLKHAFNREYADVKPNAPLGERAIAVFDAAVERISAMVVGWVRVGFCQGNFNCDNCLIAGRTMDYGPFGFIDKYDPGFAKWVGSGDHFAFMAQPGAGLANLGTLATALTPALLDSDKPKLKESLRKAETVMQTTVDNMRCSKIGLPEGSAAGPKLFATLETLMRKSDVDYTIIFRQMALMPRAHGTSSAAASVDDLMDLLLPAFYQKPCAALQENWADWARTWLAQLASEGALEGVTEKMQAANPKYILREYMLVQAYEAAKKQDFSIVHELFDLIRKPYEEQPEMEAKYYKLAPDAALKAPGTSVMT